jgi:tape measure domain-containing protein
LQKRHFVGLLDMAGARANIRAEISADTTKFQGAMRRAQTVARATGAKMGKAMAPAVGSIKKLGAAALKATATIAATGAAVAAAGIAAGAFKAVKLAADMETLSVSFKTLIGDAGLATKTLDELKQLGAETPFEFPELADAGRSLIAFGISAGDVTETLRKIGDVSAGVGAPIGEIAEIFGKAKVAGTLFAEDINQLTGRGIPVIQEFAKQLGVSESEVKAMAAAGKITFPMLEKAFGDLTSDGGKFHEMMAAQSKTTNGLFSTLKDTIGEALTEMGKPINDALRPLLGQAIEMVKALIPMAVEMGAKVGAMLEKLGSMDLAALAQRAGDALKVAVNWSLQLIEDVVYWGETFLHWIKIAGVAIAALFTPSFWASVGYSAQALFMDMGNYAIGFLNGLKDGWIQFVMSGFSFWVSVFKEFMKPDFWSGLLDVFKGIAFGFAGFILDAVAKGLELIEKIPGVKRFLGDNSSKLREMAGEFKDKSKENLDDGADTLSPIFDRIGQKAKEEAAKVGKAFTKGFAKGSETFDSESVKEQAIEAMTPIVDTMAEAISDAPARRQISDAVKELLKPAGDAAQKAGDDARRQNDPYYRNSDDENQVDVKTGLDNAARSRMFGEAARPSGRSFGEAARPSGRAFGEAGAALGGDNVFAKDRARLGIASGLSSGGLGEKRKFGAGRDEQKKKQEDYAKTQVGLLEDIDKNISAALTVA